MPEVRWHSCSVTHGEGYVPSIVETERIPLMQRCCFHDFSIPDVARSCVDAEHFSMQPQGNAHG